MSFMTSLQNKLKQLGDGLSLISQRCHHYSRVETEAPYIVWAEQYEEDSFYADNRKKNQGVHCVVDYFTKTEFDTTIDRIQQYLDESGFSWSLDNVEYEDETNLIHYNWSVIIYGQNDS